MEKKLPISLELNFTPNTLGCYGLYDTVHMPLEMVMAKNSRRKAYRDTQSTAA